MSVKEYTDYNQMGGSITIDPSCEVSPLSRIDTVRGGDIVLKEGVGVADHAIIHTYGGNIEIGKYCSIQMYCMLYGHGGLTIGNYVSIAAQTIIIPANHNFDRLDELICMQGETAKGITIGDDVWIGAGCKILDGVTIGTGSVIGAGSVVTRSIPEYSVAVGMPARVIRKRGEKEKQ